LKKKNLQNFSALFAALCWMGTPKLIGYIAGGQISTIFALSWLPWLLIFCDRLNQDVSLHKAVQIAGLSALVFYADIRWGFYMVIFSGFYVVLNSSNFKKQWKNMLQSLLVWVLGILMLTAVLSFPLIEFIKNSRRTGISLVDMNFMAISPESLFGIVAPQIGINYEQIIYFGILPLILSFFALQKKRWFWILTLLISAVYALGTSTLFYPFLVKTFPFLSLLRVPSRSWFFVVFSVAILAGYGMERIITNQFSDGFKKRFAFISFSVSLIAIFLTLGIRYSIGYVPIGMMMMAIIIPISFSFLTLVNFKYKMKNSKLLILLIVLFLVELISINSTIMKASPIPPKTEVVLWLEAQPGIFRVYSPSYSFPMPNNLQQANGVDPMHLATYAAFMGEASGISTGKYSVSLPDIYIDSQTPKFIKDLSQYPDTELLGWLNVKFLAANYELRSKNLREIVKFDNIILYENLDTKDRAWFEGGKAEIINWSPNSILIKTNGDEGRLILSEVNYPGWEATVDGISKPIEPYNGLLRSIFVGHGKHEIRVTYSPIWFFVGVIVSMAGWFGLIFFERKRLNGVLETDKELNAR
jgi:hypothetical protein